MPANLKKARAAAQHVYTARDGFQAQLDVVAAAAPPVQFTAQWSATEDVEALVFIVLMQGAESSREDLKMVMAGIKAINDAKRKWRAAVGLKPEKCDECIDPDAAFALSKAMVDAEIDKIKSDLDSMSEIGETESMRLQMAMDRLSKLMSTLSNLLKKVSDTANQITQNLK